VSLLLCWPLCRPVFTLNRQLGALSTFQTDSYGDACHWGRLAGELYDRGLLAWQIGEHTWVDYSQRSYRPVRPRKLLVTIGTPGWPDYQLIFRSKDGVAIYSSDAGVTRWLTAPRPVAAPERFPWVFRPIAKGPEPRQQERPSTQ
jgi:hypothetical protein